MKTTGIKGMAWIGWLGNVYDETGCVGTLVCGPVKRDGAIVYVVRLRYTGSLVSIDWKDILLQRGQGSPAEHYRGVHAE